MLIHGCPYFLFSLTQPATWFEFLMFPIKIIISFLLIYPSFADTLQTFKSMWNELMKLQFAGLMNFDKIQTLWRDSACQVLYPVFQLRFWFLYQNCKQKKQQPPHWHSLDLHHIQTEIEYTAIPQRSYCLPSATQTY